jgi:hypothetical protein
MIFPEDGGSTFSETPDSFRQIERRHNPEDGNLNTVISAMGTSYFKIIKHFRHVSLLSKIR